MHGEGAGRLENLLKNSDVSVIQGHIHRRQLISQTVSGHNGTYTKEAVCPGCLCRIDGTVPGRSKTPNWQQGLLVVYYTEGGAYSFDMVRIDNGTALYAGTRYTGDPDRIPKKIEKNSDWKLT